MSDPVTNVEIEDVLSSIRRLVSDGDKARTRDPAPVAPEEDEVVAAPEEAVEAPESNDDARPEKLVLSPAFMIVDNDAVADPPVKEMSSEASEDDEAGRAPQEAAFTAEPLVLPDPIEPEESAPQEEAADAKVDEAEVEAVVEDKRATETSDRASLVATIAELEAAVSASDDDYELDGSEESGETIAWPGTIARNLEDIEDAMTQESVPEAEAPEEAMDEAPVEDAAPKVQAEPAAEADPDEGAADTPAADVYEDDDLDDLLDDGAVSIDEEALRELVANVVREELTGPLGERITRNVRKLVRREIYRILSSQDFD